MSDFSNNFYVLNVPNKNENYFVEKILRTLSSKGSTPIDISDIKIKSIEAKHIPYFIDSIEWNYSCQASVGFDRRVYKNVERVRKDSDGNQRIVVEKVYSHTETDWEKYSKTDNFAAYRTVSLCIKSDKFQDKIHEKICKKISNKTFVDNLEHDKNVNINLYEDINEVDVVHDQLYKDMQEAMYKKIKKEIPGDKCEDLDLEHKIIDWNGWFINIPVNIVNYSYKGESYTARYCELIDFEMLEEVPSDEQITKISSSLVKSHLLYPVLGVAGLLFLFWFVFGDDGYYWSFNYWLIGLSASFVIYKFVVYLSEDSKEFNLIREEKDRRLNKKLKHLGLV